MTRCPLVFFWPLAASACSDCPTFSKDAFYGGLSIAAEISECRKSMADGSLTIFADVRITNESDGPRGYTNSRLLLEIPGVSPQRAYLDNVTSHAVDVMEIELAPGQSTELSVVWMFLEPGPSTVDYSTVTLVLAPN